MTLVFSLDCVCAWACVFGCVRGINSRSNSSFHGHAGDIVAFDKTGRLLSRMQTGAAGVTGLELQCSGSGDSTCRLWFTNVLEKTVSYVHVDAPCATTMTSVPARTTFKNVCVGPGAPSCKADNENTCQQFGSNKERPDFTSHMNGTGWQERMVIYHSYGKDCTGLSDASALFSPCTLTQCEADFDGAEAEACVGTVRCRVGENPDGWKDADAVKCPDRVDCSNMNLDLLVMAGFFCHPCLPNPCMNAGTCVQGEPRIGYTCECPSGFEGNTCEQDKRHGTCNAVAAVGGVYAPQSACEGTNTKVSLGQACELQCKNSNMIRVPAVAATDKVPSSAQTPSQSDLMQLTCEYDAVSKTLGWKGNQSSCACVEGYFGVDCATYVISSSKQKSVGAAGGSVMHDESRSGVTIPQNALAESVIITLRVYKQSDLGDAFPKVDTGYTTVSDIVELLPHGQTFRSAVTISVGVRAGQSVDADRLGLFFWNDATSSWQELPRSTAVTSNSGAISVEGKSHHFSRWAVLEKPRAGGSSQLHWGVWLGIAGGILVVVTAVSVCFFLFTIKRRQGESLKPNMDPIAPSKGMGFGSEESQAIHLRVGSDDGEGNAPKRAWQEQSVVLGHVNGV